MPTPVDHALLRSVARLRALGDERLAKIAALATKVEAPRGAVLFEEGEPADEIYLIVDGRLALTVAAGPGQETVLLTLGPGELTGWSGLKPHGRVATARVQRDSTLLRLPADALLALCDEDHEIGYAVFRALFDELSHRLHDTRLQLLDMFGKRER